MKIGKWIIIILAAIIIALGVWKYATHGPEPTPVPQEQQVNH
jgi:hypothetical protein